MSVTKARIATATVLITLAGSGVCLTGYCAMQAGQDEPSQATPAQEKAKPPAEKNDKMFPGGSEYDFGNVPRGLQARHAFRVVNSSGVLLRILSVRSS
jgi:hypothetical protein